ncbi:Tetratricopeptide repeat-containing protein [Lentzea albidocapillata subsp. violacea]|uniref:Tetratricopeptide repeat-containing protein n=1 Tax=Lentzea albidocapillata subsp. violacea TaxID=128104 RepID=A0A1G9QXQ4_9PSEU|nr:tetratricopeptide repeat protein [Lentzea albidocapillata]SDM15816.1 Tetratricopeptide repeat-containing protein [Lentzea albidocapillata subsp. violacea]
MSTSENGNREQEEPVALPRFQSAFNAVGGSPRKGEVAEELRPITIEPRLSLLPKHLYGRDAVKPELVKALRERDGKIWVLHGIPGGGKSTLALWLARQASDQGRKVYWVGHSDVERSMHAVARNLGVDQGRLGDANARTVVWQALEKSAEPWLLVFDNVDDVHREDLFGSSGPELDGTGWIRASRTGMVVVTSRRSDRAPWGEHAELRRVECLSHTDGGLVLSGLAPGAGTEAEAQALAERLGGLPLALRLAGRYLADDPPFNRTFVTYLHALERDLDLLDAAEPTQPALSDEEAARRSIRLTWELSLALLEQRELHAARPVLQLLSCFGAPHPIPVDLLSAEPLRLPAFDRGGTPLTETHLGRVVRGLTSSALLDQTVEPEDEAVCLRLHPLLCEVISASRDASADGGVIWSTAVSLLAASDLRSARMPAICTSVVTNVPVADLDVLAHAVDTTDECASHLLHSGAIRASHDMSRLALERASVLEPLHPVRLQARLAVGLIGRTEGHATATEELATLYGDAQQVFDQDGEFMVTLRQQLAHAAWNSNEYDLADDLYEDLMEAHDRGVCPGLRKATRFGYAQMMTRRGAFDVAEHEFLAVLEEERATWPDDPDHPDILVTRAMLADAWAGKGELVKARDELKAVLHAQERVHGSDNPLTLSARVTLMGVHSLLSEQGNAEAQLNQMLRIHHNALNPEDPLALLGIATLINMRAHSQAADADPRRDAERLIHVAVTMASTLGDDHPFVLSTRLGAAVQRHHFDHAGAREEVETVLDLQLDTHGPLHIATLSTRLVYAQMLVESEQDNAQAEEELRDLLDAQMLAFGPDNPHTSMVRSALANISLLNGDREGCQELLRQSLESLERLHGPDHDDTRETRAALARLLAELRRFAAAEQELLLLIESLGKDGPESDETLGARLLLALVHWADERHATAETEVRELLAVLARLEEDHRYDIAMVNTVLAGILREGSRLGESEALLLGVITALEELGDPDDDIVYVRLALSEVLHELGRLPEAEHHLQLLLANVDAETHPEEEDKARLLLDVVAEQLNAPAAGTPAAGTPVAGTPAAVVAEPAPAADPPPAAEDSARWRAFLTGSGAAPHQVAPAPPPVPVQTEQEVVPPAPPPRTEPLAAPADPFGAAMALLDRGQADQSEHALRGLLRTADYRVPLALARICRAGGRLAEAERLLSAAPEHAEIAGERAETARERRITHADDLRLAGALAALLRRSDLSEVVRTAVRRRYALVLADQGFLAAAHGQLAGVLAAVRRLGQPSLPCLVDVALVRPYDETTAAHLDRTYQTVVDQVGDEHALALRVAQERAVLRSEQGDVPRAVEELNAVLSARIRLSASPDRVKSVLRRALAVALRRGGDLAAARDLLGEVLGELRPALGPEHPEVLRAQAELGAVTNGELRPVLAAQLRRRGEWHPDVAVTRHHIGVLAAAGGERETARAELALAVRIRARSLGSTHPATRASEMELARV